MGMSVGTNGRAGRLPACREMAFGGGGFGGDEGLPGLRRHWLLAQVSRCWILDAT